MRVVRPCLIVLALVLVAGASASASHADDGGWAKIYDHPAGPATAIEMFDDDYGLAKIGSVVEQTTDGGLTWTATDKADIGGGPNETERWVTSFSQSPQGYPPHGPSSLRHTIDGGATWQSVDVPGYGIFLGSWFVGADGWVLATQCFPDDPTDPAAVDPPVCIDERALLHTADDGQTWSALPEPEDRVEPVIARVDELVAYRLGRLGCRDGTMYSRGCSLARIYRTTDGGQTWSDVSADVAPALGSRELRFTSPLDGWVGVGEGGSDIPLAYRSRLAHTRDGGQSWTYVEYPGLRSGVFDVTSTHVVSTANSQGIVRYDIADGTWQQAVTDARSPLESIMFVTRERGYAVADSGDGHGTRTPWVTEDGGVSWGPLATPGRLSVTSLGPDVWWATGDRPLYRSTDRGLSWQEVPLPPEADPRRGFSVQASAGDRIWLVAGVWLWRSEDAGATWRGIDIEPNPAYHYIDPDYGWTAACWPADCRSEIRMTSDGGDTWETRTIPERVSVQGFTTPLEGFGWARDPAGGRGSRTVTHDGGVTWQEEPAAASPEGGQIFGDIPVDDERAFRVTYDVVAPLQLHTLRRRMVVRIG